MGVAADGLAELGADEHEGVLLVVALLVEGLGSEAVLGGPEQQLRPLHLPSLAEDGAENGALVFPQLFKQKANSTLPEFQPLPL